MNYAVSTTNDMSERSICALLALHVANRGTLTNGLPTLTKAMMIAADVDDDDTLTLSRSFRRLESFATSVGIVWEFVDLPDGTTNFVVSG